MLFKTLGMCRPIPAASAHGQADNKRAWNLTIVHQRVFRSVIDELVECQGCEIPEHDFNDWPISGQRHAGGHPCEPGLADRRFDDLPRKTALQPLGNLECAAIRVAYILTKDDGVFDVPQEVREASIQSFDKRGAVDLRKVCG